MDNDVSRRVAVLLQGSGHTVTTAADLKLTRAKDADQLLTATQHNWVFITHNARHYKILHDAWRIWSQPWGVSSTHAGILTIPHHLPHISAQEIGVFLSMGLPLANELYFWQKQGSWTRYR